MNDREDLSVTLFLSERAGRKRVNEPVTVGLPFPQGAVFAPFNFTATDSNGQLVPIQARSLARWVDRSAKWVLLDFQADVDPNGTATCQVRSGTEQTGDTPCTSLSIQETSEGVIVNTGKGSYFLDGKLAKPFDRVLVSGAELLVESGSSLVLTDEKDREYIPYVHSFVVETSGPLRATIKAEGEFSAPSCSGFARFVLRLSFYANSNVVEICFTLCNPRPARHPGGLWDLGDEGSIYFKDLSLHIPLRSQTPPRIRWTTNPIQPVTNSLVGDLQIYQDSSGGENWRSTNHVNRFGQVKHSFQGYRVNATKSLLEAGLRATPSIVLEGTGGSVTGTFEKFWQNFPKAMEVHQSDLVLRLFPKQFGDIFELQGGEQKTHTIYLAFSGVGEPAIDLAWTHDRLLPRSAPEWYAETKACKFISPLRLDPNVNCRALMDSAIAGSQSFVARREIIDEYGWRHFGDLYADHEAVGHIGETPLVAHYNNQYDVIYGAIVQYLRGGDPRWFELMDDLARHVIDIDIYHTDKDHPAYNGGLFWHTDHYLDTATATHRSYSKAALAKRDGGSYGGGPSNEQNYTSGLLHYYYLTGDETAREAVLSLANWVIRMDDGSGRFFGFIDRRPTGLASSTTSRDYHGPGRGAGNSINALLDAYLLTHEEQYRAKAEQVICRCIHPKDNINERHLDDPEHRWSYLVFLQVLGKYLDVKIEAGENDFMYGYAQQSLIHYADWMLTHEVPYNTLLDKVEIPTETWPAQDIRKSVVFHIAATHATEPLRHAFQQKAEFFFDTCIRDLRSFRTCTLTRPIVLLLTNYYVHSYFQQHSDEVAPQPKSSYDFGEPQKFYPQFAELYWGRAKLSGLIP